MPRWRRGQKLAFHFDEDDVTLAWDAVRQAELTHGTKVQVQSLDLPAWWWQGTGLVSSGDASLVLQAVPTTAGPGVVLHPAHERPDIEAMARRRLEDAKALPEVAWQKVRLARDGPDTEADFPLGAYVTPARHEAVTAQRMRLGPGHVVSWTTIGSGAAPTEFLRLQEAVGDYHVVLVGFPDGASTVGLWTGAQAPVTGESAMPVLRRLFRTQGAWRHGIKFAPG